MFFFGRKKKTEREEKNLQDRVSLGANVHNLDIGSSAAQEWVKAYSGYDGTTGQTLAKGLKGISQSKINSDYKYQNIHQQAGFDAEVMEVANINAENIRSGNPNRATRTDDLGRVNDQVADIAIEDANGKVIDEYQMKFVGSSEKDPNNLNTARRIADKLESNKYEKYDEIAIQPEYYDEVKAELDKDIRNIENQLKTVSKNGNSEVIKQKKAQLDNLRAKRNGLRKAQSTQKEAVDARLHPLGTTAKNIAKESAITGAQCAATSAAITGSMSLVRNMKKYFDGKIDGKEAAKEIGKDIAFAGGTGFLTGGANTALASILKNSSKEVLKKLGNSSAPAQVVSFAVSTIRIFQDRSKGKISDGEVFENLTKAGVGTIGTFAAGSWGNGVGIAIGKSIGGVAGSIGGPVCAIACSLVAGIVIDTAMNYAIAELKKPIYARQEREQIEAQCAQMQKELEYYRNEFKNTYIAHTEELKNVFGNSLMTMAEALKMGDADSFLGGADNMIEALGGKSQFRTVKEFESFLDSDEAFEL